MRPLELVLAAVVVAAVLRPLLPGVRRRRGLAPALGAATLAVGAAHLLLEGGRWQLVPVYAVGLVVAVAGLAQAAGGQGETAADHDATAGRPGRLATLLGLATVVLLGASVAMAAALPVPRLPVPAGPFAVGTASFALVDASRGEPATEQADDVRRTPAQLWYPIDDRAVGDRAPLIAHARSFGLGTARALGLPPFLLDHLGLVRSNATEGAPLADDEASYPVVVYVHGWGGSRLAQAHLLESLASRGYVVLALDHTYAASAAQFPDGESIAFDPSLAPTAAGKDDVDAGGPLLATMASDVAFALAALRADEGPLPARRLALDRVGLVGHSVGGGAAVQICAEMVRCGALLALDPWVSPLRDDVIDRGSDAGLLVIRSQAWADTPNDTRLRRHAEVSTALEGFLHVAGSDHRDVTLLSLLSPLARGLGLRGETDPRRTHEVVDRYAAALFDRYLRDRDGGLLDEVPEDLLVDDLPG